MVAALIYLGFGVAGEASLSWVALEASGVLIFGLLVWLGVRRSAGWLTLGWAAHAAWDAGLHLGPAAFAFVPPWYPIFCISFDLPVAGYLAIRGRRGPAGDPTRPVT